MNKTAIKNFAIWARRELISRVSQKAAQYGITEKDSIPATADAVHGKVLSETEKKQRMSLIARIHRAGYSQTMEEIAYTWFNRFCALRFMEVNSYLPSLVRVFSDEKGDFKPQILESAIDLELDGLDREKVFAFKEANQTEELYQYLLITQCNALSSILPGMFQRIDDETELLCPDNLLREGSVISRMVCDIPEDDWNVQSGEGQIEIIGWLYQYYISEKHDEVVDPLHGKVVQKEDIPAATQLFTTDWVVRYLIDNSVGRYWIERNPDSKLAEKLMYFVKDKNGHTENQKESITPQDLTVFDPCVGSGHFLVYAFEVLIQIYTERGYTERDAAYEIVKNNLFGLDIDERASQLAYFAVMMKARQYDRRFLTRGIQPHVYEIRESNNITSDYLNYFCKDNVKLSANIKRLIADFKDAKEYGSIMMLSSIDIASIKARLEEIKNESSLEAVGVTLELVPLIQSAEVMTRRYAVVATNPPYLNKYSTRLKDFIQKHYKDYSGDLFSVFMYKNFEYCKSSGYSCFMTHFVWMFIKTYEKLRKYILDQKSIVSLIQMEYSAFEEATVPICSFVLMNAREKAPGAYIKLSDFRGGMSVQKEKTIAALHNKECDYIYFLSSKMLKKIEGYPISFWAPENVYGIFDKEQKIGDIFEVRNGITTSDNNLFLRLWHEIEYNKFSIKWFPCNKGGSFRKWFGNVEYVVDWENNGRRLKTYVDQNGKLKPTLRGIEFNFQRAITMSRITSSKNSFRWLDDGFITEGAANNIYFEDISKAKMLLSFLNSTAANYIIGLYNQTINLMPDEVRRVPFIIRGNNSSKIADSVIQLERSDWDQEETSWGFQDNPLIETNKRNNQHGKLSSAYGQLRLNWKQQCETMRKLEVENNQIFIEIYGLQDNLSPEVPWNEITLTCNPWYRYGKTPELESDGQHFSTTGEIKVGTVFGMQPTGIKVSTPNPIMKVSSFPFNQELENRLLQDTIKELLSYAVGCMFGRYSLDAPGLIYAGGKWDTSKYTSFPADEDNIIPICDDEYFKDDLSSRFVSFIKTVYGSESLEENLTFIAKALGGSGPSREVIRKYFREEFFADHCKMYQKRPIYWLFDSGKKGGFRALVYMHRYRPDTIAKMRTDYIHEQQERYRTAMADLEVRIDKASGGEKIKLEKQMREYREQAEETRLYEEKIHHLADQMISIDLDDGVKNNYAIFQDVLAKIK